MINKNDTKIPEISSIEQRVGNAAIFIEDLINALLSDPDIQKLPEWPAILNAGNRLTEGKFWLIAATSSIQRTRQANEMPTLPKK